MVIPFNLGGNDDKAYAEAVLTDGEVLLADYAMNQDRNTDMAVTHLQV